MRGSELGDALRPTKCEIHCDTHVHLGSTRNICTCTYISASVFGLLFAISTRNYTACHNFYHGMRLFVRFYDPLAAHAGARFGAKIGNLRSQNWVSRAIRWNCHRNPAGDQWSASNSDFLPIFASLSIKLIRHDDAQSSVSKISIAKSDSFWQFVCVL